MGGSTVLRARENRGQRRFLPMLQANAVVTMEAELWIETHIFHRQRVKVEEILMIAPYAGMAVTVTRHHNKSQTVPVIRIGDRDAWLGFEDIRAHLFSRLADRLKKRDLYGE